MGGHV
jgi:hypothetical protein